jgi:Sulfotransferase family
MLGDQHLARFSPSVAMSEFIYSVNISLAHRYVYVETPKAGCSTLKSLLIRAELDQDFQFMDDEHVHRRDRSPLLNPRQVGDFAEFMQQSLFKFCFVRDPYSRLLSNYLDKIANPAARRDRMFQQIARQLGIDAETGQVTFSQFVEAVAQQPVEVMDPHWRTQYYQTFQQSFRYDFTGRFETFAADLRLVCDRIGVDFDRWYRREAVHATNASARIDEFYTEELRELVYSKYRIDFEHFGYPAKWRSPSGGPPQRLA